MSQVSFSDLTNGIYPDASDFNTRFNALKNRINNGMEADNIASSAVTTAKINNGAVTATKMSLTDNFDWTGDHSFSGGVDFTGSTLTGFTFMAHTGSNKNLLVVRNSATQITVTADELVVGDGTNNVLIRSVNKSIAITTSGEGGLDTGSEGSSRWYFAWIIRKSTDGTVSAILSESSSVPTMPTGYDQKALLSAVYNNSSSDFVAFSQTGFHYSYTPHRQIFSGNLGMGSWTSTDVSAFVPSALSNRLVIGLMGGSNSYSAVSNINTAGLTTNVSSPDRWGAGDNQNGDYCEVNIITANTLYFASTDVGNAAYAAGFIINKL